MGGTGGATYAERGGKVKGQGRGQFRDAEKGGKRKARKVFAVALHGKLRQPIRESALASFKSGKVSILVATDLAARGIHVSNLCYVVNFDVPKSIELYVHRVGRTGRQGMEGQSCTLAHHSAHLTQMAGGLVSLLLGCGQNVPPKLVLIAEKEKKRRDAIERAQNGGSAAEPETEAPEGEQAGEEQGEGVEEGEGGEGGEGGEDEDEEGGTWGLGQDDEEGEAAEEMDFEEVK
jgi:superfamily II DNA/RNA helicase